MFYVYGGFSSRPITAYIGHQNKIRYALRPPVQPLVTVEYIIGGYRHTRMITEWFELQLLYVGHRDGSDGVKERAEDTYRFDVQACHGREETSAAVNLGTETRTRSARHLRGRVY